MVDSTSDPSGSTQNHGPQDEAVSSALRRRLQVCYERGLQLAKEGDHDYAHEMFAECVGKDPSNLIYAEAMLENLQKKYNNNKKGARFKGFGGKGAIKKAAQSKDWQEVLRLAPDLLKVNPWDVVTLRALAQACEALHYNEVELRYLKNALVANPKNPDVNRHCALSLARMGQFDQAIACWHRIEEANKGDPEAPRRISELTLQKARQSAGIADDAELVGEAVAAEKRAAEHPLSKPSGPAPEKPVEKPVDGPAEPPVSIRLNPRQKLEKAITDNPTDIENYTKLAELLSGDGRHAEAERVLHRALAASGNDLAVREQLENVQIRRARAQLAVAERQASVRETTEAQELVKKLKSDLNRLELEIFGARCQRYPDDKAVRYELGVRLKRAGNFSEAVKYLQEAQSVAKFKPAATLEVGECLQQLRQYRKALECYAWTAQHAGSDDDRKKLALYRAGVLAQGLQEQEIAAKHLAHLVDIDPSYRDASSRLDKVRQIRDD